MIRRDLLRMTSAAVLGAALLAGAHAQATAQDQGGKPGAWWALAYPDPAPGLWRTWCFGMNELGDSVGYYVSGGNKAFLLADGQYSSLHPSGAGSSMAWGINSGGEVVGEFTDSAAHQHGALWSGDTLTSIDLPGQMMTHPRDINARGDITGAYMTTSSSPTRGFILEADGTVTDVDYPGATSTFPYGISDRGEVAGEYQNGSVVHGFIRSADGEFESLDFPGSTSTSVQKISANGTVVGYYYASGLSHGFVFRHGEFARADYPGATQTMLHGINNQGETCGMMRVPGNTLWGGFMRTW
jgi:uncharacterized membrane protein